MSQLVEYYPGPSEDKAGRRWSVRYGIIGRTWRLDHSLTETDVSTEENLLVADWGMTIDEATNWAPKMKSFTAAILRNSVGRAIAVFYLDSTMENVLLLPEDPTTKKATKRGKDNLHKCIEEACKKIGLTYELEKIARRIEQRKLDIRIFG